MLYDAARSLICSLAIILTCWLILPVIVLFPLALVFGYKFYKKSVLRFRRQPIMARVLGAIPVTVALGAVYMLGEILQTYRA